MEKSFTKWVNRVEAEYLAKAIVVSSGEYRTHTDQDQAAERIRLGALFWTFFRIGLFTFGGGLAMLPVIRHELVLKRRWVREEDFISMMSLATMVPGVIAVNLAYLLGRRLRGIGGAGMAIVGTILPSFCVIILIAWSLLPFFSYPWVQAFFKGAAIAVAGQLAFAGFTFARKLLRGWQSWVITGLALGTVFLFKIHPIWALVVSGMLGLVLYSKSGDNTETGGGTS